MSSQEKVVFKNSTEITTEPTGSMEDSTLPTRLPTMLQPLWNRLKERTVPKMITQASSSHSLPPNWMPSIRQGRKTSSMAAPPMVIPHPVTDRTENRCMSFRGDTV